MVFIFFIKCKPSIDPVVKSKYKKHCFACHGTGAANAPRIGDKAAWNIRLSKGPDVMLDSLKKGMVAMPPNGRCNECSDKELKKIIKYMME